MIENAMELGAKKLALEEINKKIALGAVHNEIELLAKGLGVSTDAILAVLIDTTCKELADVEAAIIYSSAVGI